MEKTLNQNREILTEYSNHRISKVRVVVHQYLQSSHWSIYRPLHNSTYTIRMNMAVDDDHPTKGVFCLSAYNQPVPEQGSIRFWDFEVIGNVTFKTVTDYVLGELKRQHFHFALLGGGCRYWWQVEPIFATRYANEM